MEPRENLSLPIHIKPFRVRSAEAWSSFLSGEHELRALMAEPDRAAVSETLAGTRRWGTDAGKQKRLRAGQRQQGKGCPGVGRILRFPGCDKNGDELWKKSWNQCPMRKCSLRY